MTAAVAPQAMALDVGGEDFDDVVDGAPLMSEEGGEEETFAESSSDKPQDSFDAVLTELEVLMMDEELNARVDAFTREHCMKFDAGDENKLEYTSLFAEYTGMVEAYIEERVGASVASFDMASFCATLSERAQSDDGLLDQPAFEMLVSYSDFDAFKQLMLSARQGLAVEAQTGELCVSGDKLGLSSSGMAEGLDDEDGGDSGAMGDLGDLLCVSGSKPK